MHPNRYLEGNIQKTSDMVNSLIVLVLYIYFVVVIVICYVIYVCFELITLGHLSKCKLKNGSILQICRYVKLTLKLKVKMLWLKLKYILVLALIFSFSTLCQITYLYHLHIILYTSFPLCHVCMLYKTTYQIGGHLNIDL